MPIEPFKLTRPCSAACVSHHFDGVYRSMSGWYESEGELDEAIREHLESYHEPADWLWKFWWGRPLPAEYVGSLITKKFLSS